MAGRPEQRETVAKVQAGEINTARAPASSSSPASPAMTLMKKAWDKATPQERKQFTRWLVRHCKAYVVEALRREQ